MAEQSIGLAAVLDDRQFQEGLKRYTAGIASMEKVTANAAKSISGFGIAAATAFGTMLGNAIPRVLGALKSNIVDAGMSFNAMMEQSTIAFTTILGDGGKAKSLLDDLAKFAAATPFEFPELVDASKKLLAFGFDAKSIIPTMTRLGDISAGLGIPVSELADLYGKARVQGRLFAEDINQLTGRGIPIAQELAGQFGVSEDKVRGLVEAGKVGFPNLEKAFISLTTNGGKFAGLMEAQSQSFNGLMSTLKDNLTQIAGQLTKPIFDRATKWLKTLTDYLGSTSFQSKVKSLTDILGDLADMFDDLLAGNNLHALRQFYDLIEKTFGRDTAQKVYGVLSALGGVKDFIQGQVIPTVRQLSKVFGNLIAGFGEASGDFSDFYSSLSDLMGADIAGLLTDIAVSIRSIVDAFKAGGLGGAVKQFADEIQKAWPTVQAALSTWKDQFWTWLTGKGGAIEQAITQIGAVAKSIADWLAVKWDNTIQPTLIQWKDQFWNWLTNPQNGAIAYVSDKMGELAKQIKDWAESEDTKSKLRDIGKSIAQSILNGTGDQLGDPTAVLPVLRQLDRNLLNLVQSLMSAWGEIGYQIGYGLGEGVRKWLEDPQTWQDLGNWLSNAFRQGVANMLTSGVIDEQVAAMVAAWNAIMAQFHFNMPWDNQTPPQPSTDGGSVPSSFNTNMQYAAGGWVTRTTPALVHAGEYVIPARPTARGGMGSPINIVNNWPDSIAQTDRFQFEQIAERAAYRALTRVMQEAPA